MQTGGGTLPEPSMKFVTMRNEKLKWFVTNLLKNFAMIALAMTAVGLWQTRELPKVFPQVSLIDGDGGKVFAFPSQHSKPRVSLVYIFAPWCGVCKLSMPNLEQLRQKMPNLEIIPLALDFESASDVSEFIVGSGYLGRYFSGSSAVRDALGINAYPTYLVITDNGSVRASSVGYSTQFGMIMRVLWAQLLS